jgi:hypothetical protein
MAKLLSIKFDSNAHNHLPELWTESDATPRQMLVDPKDS